MTTEAKDESKINQARAIELRRWAIQIATQASIGNDPARIVSAAAAYEDYVLNGAARAALPL